MAEQEPTISPDASNESVSGSHDRSELKYVHIWEIQAIRDLLVVAAAVGIVWLGYVLRTVTVPLLIALLLAYLFEPIIQWLCRLERGKLSRIRAVTLLLITVGTTVIVVLLLTIPLVVSQSVTLVRSFSPESVRERLSEVTPHLPGPLKPEWERLLSVFGEPRAAQDDSAELPEQWETDEQEKGERSPAGASSSEQAVQRLGAPPPSSDAGAAISAEEELDHRIERLIEQKLSARLADSTRTEPIGFWSYLGTAATWIKAIAMYSLQLLALFVLIPFYFFFFSVGYPRVLSVGHALIPVRNRERVVSLIHKMDRVVSGFVRGRIVISFITGILFSIGWWVCGVPYAWAVGMVTGAFFLVPYLAGVGLPLAIGLLFFERLGDPGRGDMWLLWAIVNPTIVFAVVQLIETYILTPKIAGQATNLDPVTVVVAVLAGGSLLGVYGMLLAIPLAACGKILLLEVLFPKIDAWLKGERPDPLPIERG